MRWCLKLRRPSSDLEVEAGGVSIRMNRDVAETIFCYFAVYN